MKKIGIDFSTVSTELVDLKLEDFNGVDYIYLDLEELCDFVIGETKKINSYSHKIITKINCVEEYDFFLECHLGIQRRRKVDILILGKSEVEQSLEERWSLATEIISDKRVDEIGVEADSVADLEVYQKITGWLPRYCLTNLNPLYFNKELIDFCRENKILIIGRDILGQKSLSKAFSMTYLLGFAKIYADIILFSHSTPELRYMIKDLNNIEVDPESPLWKARKTVVKKTFSPTRGIFEYLKLGKELIPIDSNGSWSPSGMKVLSLKGDIGVIEGADPESWGYWVEKFLEKNDFELPQEWSEKTKRAFLYYSALGSAKELFKIPIYRNMEVLIVSGVLYIMIGRYFRKSIILIFTLVDSKPVIRSLNG